MNTHKDKGDEKYKKWDDPVAITFDKAGRRGIQYKKLITTSSKTNKMEDLKEELRGRLFYVGLPKKYWPGLVQFFEENIAQAKEDAIKQNEEERQKSIDIFNRKLRNF